MLIQRLGITTIADEQNFLPMGLDDLRFFLARQKEQGEDRNSTQSHHHQLPNHAPMTIMKQAPMT
jgi:hypothetical protein